MDRLKNILVAVDFSSCSAAAFRQAMRIAAWNDASVKALHIVPVPIYALDPQPFIPFDLPAMSLLVNEARKRWARWEPARNLEPSVSFDAVLAVPRIEILDRVRRDKPDLLVIGAYSEKDAKRGVGTTAAAIVQRAATRVLVVRDGQIEPFRSVLACIDFTDTSKAALEQAIRVAAQDGCSLHILHVYDDPWQGIGPPTGIKVNMPDIARRYQQGVEDRLRSFCEPLAHETGALKAEFHAIQFTGHGKGIIEFAERQRCDLVVLGTRSKWNLHDLFWGSTAERVVREAHCSVLTVKPSGFVQT